MRSTFVQVDSKVSPVRTRRLHGNRYRYGMVELDVGFGVSLMILMAWNLCAGCREPGAGVPWWILIQSSRTQATDPGKQQEATVLTQTRHCRLAGRPCHNAVPQPLGADPRNQLLALPTRHSAVAALLHLTDLPKLDLRWRCMHVGLPLTTAVH